MTYNYLYSTQQISSLFTNSMVNTHIINKITSTGIIDIHTQFSSMNHHQITKHAVYRGNSSHNTSVKSFNLDSFHVSPLCIYHCQLSTKRYFTYQTTITLLQCTPTTSMVRTTTRVVVLPSISWSHVFTTAQPIRKRPHASHITNTSHSERG